MTYGPAVFISPKINKYRLQTATVSVFSYYFAQKDNPLPALPQKVIHCPISGFSLIAWRVILAEQSTVVCNQSGGWWAICWHLRDMVSVSVNEASAMPVRQGSLPPACLSGLRRFSHPSRNVTLH